MTEKHTVLTKSFKPSAVKFSMQYSTRHRLKRRRIIEVMNSASFQCLIPLNFGAYSVSTVNFFADVCSDKTGSSCLLTIWTELGLDPASERSSALLDRLRLSMIVS